MSFIPVHTKLWQKKCMDNIWTYSNEWKINSSFETSLVFYSLSLFPDKGLDIKDLDDKSQDIHPCICHKVFLYVQSFSQSARETWKSSYQEKLFMLDNTSILQNHMQDFFCLTYKQLEVAYYTEKCLVINSSRMWLNMSCILISHGYLLSQKVIVRYLFCWAAHSAAKASM